MKTSSKILLRAAAPLVLALAVSGCSGVQARHSVSPASILLPGLLQADPPKTAPAHSPIQPSAAELALR